MHPSLAVPVEGAVPLHWYLILAISMFAIGGVGVVLRRNPVIVFMCIELMLNAVNLTFLAFAYQLPANPMLSAEAVTKAAMTGQIMVVFVMAVAAAEVAVGLGIIMAILRNRSEVDIDDMSTMRG